MKTTLVERRNRLEEEFGHAGPQSITNSVRQGMLLQVLAGTLGAVEYLKANEVPGSVIGRVLSGGATRAEDRPHAH